MAKLTTEQKEALERFKKSRGGVSEALRASQKELLKAQRAIREVLEKGPATVPAIAAAAGLPADGALFYVIMMRKYGGIEEKGQEGDYPLYALTGKDGDGKKA